MILYDLFWFWMPFWWNYGHVWPCMDIHGRTWPYMAIHGHIWPRMVMHGRVWPCMARHGHIWPCMAMHGHAWPYMAMYGHAWPCVAMHGRTWPYIRIKSTTIRKAKFHLGAYNCEKIRKTRVSRFLAFCRLIWAFQTLSRISNDGVWRDLSFDIKSFWFHALWLGIRPFLCLNPSRSMEFCGGFW